MDAPRVYLDHNATSPLLPEALEAMLPFLRDGAANPSSTHRDGQRARLAIEEAREDVATLAGVSASEIVLTSGGTEAANAAIVGPVYAHLGEGVAGFPAGASVVSTTLEHPAVHRALRGLERRGLEVRRVAPRADGVVDAAAILDAVDEGTLLVSVMHVNNEIGTIQPVDEIAAACAARSVPIHTDAVQALGRIPLQLNASLLGLSAHKIGGPQGVGALIVKKGVLLEPLLRGGPQEMRRRAGTENTAGIVGFGAAARATRARLADYSRRVGALRARLEAGLRSRFPGVTIHGSDAPRVANTSCFALPGPGDGGAYVDGVALQMAVDLEGFSVSTGTACASGKTGPSYVLQALGAPDDVARGSLRVSLGWSNTEIEVDRFLEALESAWTRLTASASVVTIASRVAHASDRSGNEPIRGLAPSEAAEGEEHEAAARRGNGA